MILRPHQSKMARVGLGLGVRDIAKLAKVSPNTITRLERGERMFPRTHKTIRRAFEDAGAVFIDEDGGGVKLRK